MEARFHRVLGERAQQVGFLNRIARAFSNLYNTKPTSSFHQSKVVFLSLFLFLTATTSTFSQWLVNYTIPKASQSILK